MKKCSKCRKEKPFEEFNFKIKSTGFRQYQCKVCTRLYIKNHYNRNRGYYLEKAKKRNAEIKIVIYEYICKYLLKHPCVDCGESDLEVLEFDHKGEIPKFKAVSHMIRAQSKLYKIIEEISKCEVRCANCHRRKTAKQFKWFRINKRP